MNGSNGKNAIRRLLAAIEYPERMPEGGVSFMLRVDGAELFAEESDGRITLSRSLTEDEALLPRLAAYAVGRMLKEDATLAWGRMPGDEIGNHPPSAFLWQSVPADAEANTLLFFFESFMNSCDWWRARVDTPGATEKADNMSPETMVIMP